MAKLPNLRDLISVANIAPFLNDDTLNSIGAKVVQEFDSDLESTKDWRANYESAMKVAMQTRESKSFPWPNAANIRFPAIAMAGIQFAARAYPEIVQDGKVAGCKIVGRDPDGQKQLRADRISMHMSYQLVEQIPEWDEATDKLLHVLPIAGLCWRKTYFDTNKGVCSDFIDPLDCVVHYHTKSLEECRRVTHIFPLHKNSIIEHQRAAEYLDVELGEATQSDDYDSTETDTPHIFLEQHRWLDLDDDGYDEPYIVTVHRDSRKVVRIVARYDEEGITMYEKEVVRIEPIQYFTKIPFIPAPDGSFYDIGFGVLLGPLNDTINTLFNQLIDSGTLANAGGGFLGKGARLPGGKLTFKPGEWKPIDVGGQILKDSIIPFPSKDPSIVLYQLLNLLIDVTKQLSTVSEQMTGDAPMANETATSTLARIEQGMKVFSAVHKRIYRSLTKELKKIYRLNRLYAKQDEYANIIDDEMADVRADYEDESIDVRPVADPNMTTDMQRLIRAQAVIQIVAQVPGGNIVEASRRALEALHITDVDALLPDENAPQQPDPAALEAQAKMQMEQQRLQMETMAKQAEMELRAKEMQLKMDLEKQKHTADLHRMGMELQLKTDELTVKNEAEQRKIDNERAKLAFDAQAREADFQLRMSEIERKFEIEIAKLDNEMQFKEHTHESDQNHQLTLKAIDLDLANKNEKLKKSDEATKITAEMLHSLMAKQSGTKKIVRDESGKITHVVVEGPEEDDVQEVVRDKTGKISHIKPTKQTEE